MAVSWFSHRKTIESAWHLSATYGLPGGVIVKARP